MKIADGFILDCVGGEYVGISLDYSEERFSGMIKLTSVGAFLWELLMKDVTETDLVQAITERYQVEEAIAARDIRRFLQQLEKNGILEK